MYHFEKMSTRPPPRSCPWTLLGDFRPSDPIIAPPPGKNPTEAHGVLLSRDCRKESSVSKRKMIIQRAAAAARTITTVLPRVSMGLLSHNRVFVFHDAVDPLTLMAYTFNAVIVLSSHLIE